MATPSSVRRIRDQAIVYDEIEQTSDLRIGWTDEQDAGRYRLARRADAALLRDRSAILEAVPVARQVTVWPARVDEHGGLTQFETPDTAQPRYAFLVAGWVRSLPGHCADKLLSVLCDRIRSHLQLQRCGVVPELRWWNQLHAGGGGGEKSLTIYRPPAGRSDPTRGRRHVGLVSFMGRAGY